ncbi:hypothetical protein HJA_00905 [Hyphomonas jannaschiana VP2]|uniref:Uncharacterized protein n=2 Tax=Hyphomonas jannaschiana TaxID=86 RepID=A0A059FKT0_9PROT|nr:hypothetical protein HJA_00905 [Hyphomonas jannaschiana VP2]
MMDQRGAFDELGPLPDAENRSLTELLDSGALEFQINNAVYLDKIFQMTKQTHSILLNGFRWNLVKSPLGRVIISDHPLTFVHPGRHFGLYGIPPGGDDCEMAFPLSKHLYLVGLWEREFESFESEEAVNELNTRQAIFASRHFATSFESTEWLPLALQFRNFSFRTKADTLEHPAGAIHSITGGVFPIESAEAAEEENPLLGTKPIIAQK